MTNPAKCSCSIGNVRLAVFIDFTTATFFFFGLMAALFLRLAGILIFRSGKLDGSEECCDRSS